MCTGIRLISKDHAVVYGRTMEFGKETDSNIIFIPREHPFSGELPSNQPGLSWKSEYTVIGANMLGQVGVVDGINEKGLAGGLFYFPHYAEYEKITEKNYTQAIAPWQLLTWILSTCKTVAEVAKKITEIYVTSTIFEGWDQTPPPIHAVVHDTSGACLMIEYINGKRYLYDNPLGIITNAPSFDWHLTNLNNYAALSCNNVTSKKVGPLLLKPTSQGSGMLGLPGDFMASSRFVRATFLSQSIEQPETADAARDALFHLLNLFDIPKGAIREQSEETTYFERTQWTSVADLANFRYYWHTYENRQKYGIDFSSIENNGSKPIIIPMHHPEMIINAIKN